MGGYVDGDCIFYIDTGCTKKIQMSHMTNQILLDISILSLLDFNITLLTSVRTGCWSPPRKCTPFRRSGRKRPLSGTQHNFHETKRETLKRARPQVVTSRDNRLTDTSRDGRERKVGSMNRKHCQGKPLKRCHRQPWVPRGDRGCLLRTLNEMERL